MSHNEETTLDDLPALDITIKDEKSAYDAITGFDELSEEQKAAQSEINKILANNEPFVDINELFGHYNVLYFRSLLLPRVDVLWSSKLTLCAGICDLTKDPATGKYTRVRVKLSTPLLQYRPRSDTINTLLHEAIHAYFFITVSWRHSRGDDGTGHGVAFQRLAEAINRHGGYEVTTYHTFHDEVDSYRTHIWKCNGPCQEIPPFFGVVKRSMNRAPGKGDSWWADHEATCNGTFTKIQAPELTKKQLLSLSKKERAGRQKNKIDSWLQPKENKTAAGKPGRSESTIAEGEECDLTKHGQPPKGNIRKAAETVMAHDMVARPSTSSTSTGQKRDWRESNGEQRIGGAAKRLLVECPICGVRIAESGINEHLDVEHGP